MKFLTISFTASLVYLVYYLGRLNLGALIPIIREKYAFSNSELGLVAASMYLAYTIMQLPSGILTDKIGPKATIVLGCILIAIGNFTMITWVFPLLILAQLINGVGQSTGWSSLVKFGCAQGRGEERKILGAISSSVPAGTFIAYLFAGLIVERLGLDYAFIIPALVLVAVAFLIHLTFPSSKYSRERPPEQFGFKLMRKRNIFALSFIQLSILSTMNGLFVWLPALLVDLYRIESYEAYRFASIFPLPGIIGGIVGGYFATKFGDKRSIFVNQLMLTVLIFLMILFVSLSFLQFFAILLLLSIFLRFGSASLFSLAVKTVGDELAGTVSGLLNFVGSVGSFVITQVIGLILDYYPLVYVFYLYSCLLVFSLFFATVLSET